MANICNDIYLQEGVIWHPLLGSDKCHGRSVSMVESHNVNIYMYLHPCCSSAGELFLMTAEAQKRRTGKNGEGKTPQFRNTRMMGSLCFSTGTTLYIV